MSTLYRDGQPRRNEEISLAALQGAGWDSAEESAAMEYAHAEGIGYVSYGDGADPGTVYIQGTTRTIIISRATLDRTASRLA